MATFTPGIPENITVHLGLPTERADDVTVPFAEYIANVASSEIYPTWPESAIRANILAQISFALNRVFTAYYPSLGYDFDITSSTAYDQAFIRGRDVFENVQRITSELFTDYIRRKGNAEPLFAAYCDGAVNSCEGLSQWGSLSLAQEGKTPEEILKYYYGNDIEIVRNAPIQNEISPPPAAPLRPGSGGDDVRRLQIRLNRISLNYPMIPKIPSPDGLFDTATENAVLEFQRIFNLQVDGIVGNSTWYTVQRIYNAVKRLNELNSEGVKLSETSQEFPEALHPGDEGLGVANLQYFLSYIAGFDSAVRPVPITAEYDETTEAAVKDAQTLYGLPVTGITDAVTWDKIYRAYLGIVSTIPPAYAQTASIPYQGTILRVGSDSDEVRLLQEYLAVLAEVYPEIPTVEATGYFGKNTEASVIAAQKFFGLKQTGIVGALTWAEIAGAYDDVIAGRTLSDGQYPGYTLEREENA